MSFTDTKVYVLSREIKLTNDKTVKKYLGDNRAKWFDNINDKNVKFYTSYSEANDNKIAWQSIFTKIDIEEF